MPTALLEALDEIDRRILGHLQRNARVSNAKLAELVGLSPAPCLRRIRALEEAGIIRDYVALLDTRAVGRAVTVFIEIRLDLQVKDRLDILERAIREWPEVLECNLMTGDADYMLRVAVPDVDAYEHFLRDKLTRLEGVASVKSSFALKQVKYTTALPLGSEIRSSGARR
ncbi:MAG: Lrp/AsnC family transcriptional regulator [Acidobacteria bacterium]|nr:Lrp/AsnC family transcriptional regulator [Acidobacteriota bacterium]